MGGAPGHHAGGIYRNRRNARLRFAGPARAKVKHAMGHEADKKGTESGGPNRISTAPSTRHQRGRPWDPEAIGDEVGRRRRR